MSYIALARKYRPRKLSELIGQTSLVETLKNAIELNRIHHAFIFTGTRGVGKTTTARIMALSLNCIGADGNGGETIDPCLECKNCQEILNLSHPDVIEIDAASNTGVDFARELIESTKYPPMTARYKVFIVDEVHMLSKSAFNALLKTIEEPNKFIKFIFATTEYNKIPITIASRCQKFFLQNLKIEDLVQNIKNICEKENLTYEESAIEHIAKMARGSARDSLSLMDQVISISSGSHIGSSDISQMSSISGGSDYAFEILDNITTGNVEKSLEIGAEVLRSGYGSKILISNMIDLISQTMESICTKKHDQKTQKLCQNLDKTSNLSIQVLDRLYQVLAQSASFIDSIEEKSVLDTLIIRLSFINKAPTLEEIISSLVNN